MSTISGHVAIFFIYRDIFYISRYFLYIAIFFIYRDIFWSYRDTNVHRIYGDRWKNRRKYTKSHATSVGPHTHTFQFRCGVRTYVL